MRTHEGFRCTYVYFMLKSVNNMQWTRSCGYNAKFQQQWIISSNHPAAYLLCICSSPSMDLVCTYYVCIKSPEITLCYLSVCLLPPCSQLVTFWRAWPKLELGAALMNSTGYQWRSFLLWLCRYGHAVHVYVYMYDTHLWWMGECEMNGGCTYMFFSINYILSRWRASKMLFETRSNDFSLKE